MQQCLKQLVTASHSGLLPLGLLRPLKFEIQHEFVSRFFVRVSGEFPSHSTWDKPGLMQCQITTCFGVACFFGGSLGGSPEGDRRGPLQKPDLNLVVAAGCGAYVRVAGARNC